MPHPLDYPSPTNEALYSTAIGPLTPTLEFEISSQTHNGTAWSGTASNVSVNMTSRISDDRRISVTLQKQILPGDDGFAASTITVPTVNADGHWSVTQTGAKIDPLRFEQGEVRIGCQVQKAGTNIRIFKGRVDGRPSEQFGETIWKVRDLFLDALQEPVAFEKIELSGNKQNSYVSAGQLINQASIINDTSPTLNPSISRMRLYDGYVVFAEDGRLITTVTNNKTDQIVLNDISVKSGAKLGKYVIEFQDGTGYTVTFPDNSTLNGSVWRDFDSEAITIKTGYWSANGTPLKISPTSSTTAIDASGAKIEFFVCFTVAGNPVTIIMNLIEKALVGNWGSKPGFGKYGASTGLNVNWAAFWKLERYYRRHIVYVSETNENNDVWQEQTGNRPLNCLNLAQRIADHIGCNIERDLDGNITIYDRKVFNEDIWPITDNDGILEASISGIKAENYLRVQYGENIMANGYGSEVEKDLRVNTSDLKVEKVMRLPYFKVGISDNNARSMASFWGQRLVDSQVQMTLKMTPNFVVPLLPGDRFRLQTFNQPAIDRHVEVHRMTKTADASGFHESQVQVFGVSDPAGAVSEFCSYRVGDQVIC